MEVLGEDRREGLGRKVSPRVSLFLMLLVSLIMLLFSLYSAEASIFRKARESVLDASSPILSVLSMPINAINNVFGDIGDYFHVVEENRALRQENAELRQWMEEALALRDLVSVYEKLQSYQSAPSVTPIDAHVISDSNDVFARSMIINIGTSKNIRTGLAVVNEAGLVGRLLETGRVASRVLLLSDIQSRIPVYIENGGVEGILVGRTRQRPVINFTSRVLEAPLEVGVKVFTSGAGGVIPRGIPVGTVAEIRDREISINLYADYSKTRLVRVLDYDFPGIGVITESEQVSEELDLDELEAESPSDENAQQEEG